MSATSPLMSPWPQARMPLKNRVALAAQTTNFSEGPGLSQRHLDYYRQRLEGGVALLINDPVPVHPSSQTLRTRLSLEQDSDRHYAELLQLCRQHEALALQQLTHDGAHGCAATAFMPAWSPSGLPSLRDQDTSHAMNPAEIETLLDAFVSKALQAQALGFAGVELVAGGKALIEQFWHPASNRREDEWGGDRAGRMRFSSELVRRLRQACGDAFIIGLKLTSAQGYGNHLDPESLQQVIDWHESQGGVDYYSLSLSSPTPDADELARLAGYRARLVRAGLTIAGNVLDTDLAQQLVDSGIADWVGLDRALLADAHWARHDTAEAIRPCVDCHQRCTGLQARDYAIGCLVAPETGAEAQLSLTATTDRPCRVLVAGGGLAGLEAACSAARLGHAVTLVEQSDQLGGSWRLAARLPGRQRLHRLLDWYRRQLDQLDIEVRLGYRAETLPWQDYDRLIIATGTRTDNPGFQRLRPDHPQLPGLENGHVISAETLLAQPEPWGKQPGQRILVLDDAGQWPGLGSALWLAETGHRVTLLSRHAQPAPELAGLPDYAQRLAQLQRLNIRWRGNSQLLHWHGDRAELVSAEMSAPVTEPFDWLVLACTPLPDQRLEHLARERGLNYILAGDCQGPRKAHMAILEGRRAALSLTHPPATAAHTEDSRHAE